VPLAPYLSVTFNQPMVALTGLEDPSASSGQALAQQAVPVKLSPQPEGKWRWVGTKTLMFEPSYRFPMATQYTAEIAAGTKSATGGMLAKTVAWTFTTPPPTVQTFYPTNDPQRRDVLMFAAFDQRIEPDAVLPTIKVKAGQTEQKLRLATADEVQADKTVRRMAANAGEGRWLAFRAAELLPADTGVTVTVGPDTPSAEGPLKTTAGQSFSFRTYGPLKVTRYQCGWDRECPPFAPWYVEFSNPLDETAFEDALVRVEPTVPGLNVAVYGNSLNIQGRTAGRTTYKVTLSANIRDLFGQTLGKDQLLTFTTTSAEPALSAPGGNFIVLDPSAKPTYSVFTINFDRLKVRAYAVQPEDWPAFQTYMQNYYREGTPPTPPGRQVVNTTITVKAKPDELVETAIDLSPALKDGLGQIIVVVEPDVSALQSLFRPGERPPTARAWVQATRIGLDAFVDGERMIAWANSLLDGAPLNGVEFTLSPAGKTATTNDAGIATLALPEAGANLLVARQGADVAFLPQNLYWWGEGGWQRRPAADEPRWYVFDDRQMYRPGEAVHVKGWIRFIGGGVAGDVKPWDGGIPALFYRLRDSRGNEILTGNTPINALGGFTLAFTLTETMNLGYANLELSGPGQYNHQFQVQEFRRPEFEVKASASEGPHLVGGFATTEVAANYYAGGGLPNAEVTWNVSSTPGHYSPPGWDDFTFGTWVPWWGGWRGKRGGVVVEGPWRPGPWVEEADVETYTGHTDAAGVHRLRIDFFPVDPPEPTVIHAEASVMDVNRQAWTAGTDLLVHPAALYVGLRSERVFVEREQPLDIDAIVTDLDGKPVPGREIKMRAARLEWKYRDGTWQEEEVVVQPCTVQSATEPVRCTFETPEGGTYRITATITDDQGRANRSQLTRWVSGGGRPPARQVEQEEVTLIPDRKEYQPGDTAEILVQAPFFPAEGTLTLRRSGIVSSQPQRGALLRFTMDGPSYTLKVPIQESYIPNLYVQVDLVGAAPRTDDAGQVKPELPKRPAYATGTLNLSVPPLARALSVEVTPRDAKLEPGGKTVVDVVLKDAAGRPVEGGELAVAVVDEAILALTNYDLPDPMAVFYSERSPDVEDYHTRANIVLVSPEELLAGGTFSATRVVEKVVVREVAPAPAAAATQAPAPAAMEARGEDTGVAAPIAVRADFNPLAAFAPAVPTDAQGRAQIEVKLPDNLTRYRVMVVAVAGGKQFGKGESAITARLPLMVRPSAPRFLNFGDRFELPVVLQNQTDTAMTVDVAVRGTNIALSQTFSQTFRVSETLKVSTVGKRVTVPANDRVEVRFPAATVRAGIARFQIGASQVPAQPPKGGASMAADAAQVELPVWTPATTEAFATYGTLDEGAVAQPVIAPSGVFTQFGGLEITTSSTALQALTDAFLYLQSYPFECSEQLASRILAVAALRDVLSAFKAEGLPAPAEIEKAMARDIERLRGMQNEDGGFSTWRKGEESWPYHSIHVAHALQRAKAKGYAVPGEMIARSLTYLQNVERHISPWYGESARRSLIAYALYVRNLMGDRDPARARKLIAEAGLEKLPLETIGWLLPVLSDDPNSKAEVDAIRRLLANRVTETAGAAHFTTSYGADAYLLLHSDRRTDGVLLDALIGDQPDSDLIPKLVAGLLAHRVAGRWGNTQENAFILLALDRYFNTYEAQTPDFVARIWLGDRYAGDATFKGRTTDYQQLNVPMSYVATLPVTSTLILNKEGAGRLYYRLGLRYAPTDLKLPPYDAGFTVERTYEGVDNPADVRKEADGVWHVKAGARVRVRLTMIAEARRYHVALVDPLPAGFEAMNPALAVTGSVPQDPKAQTGRYWWWWRTWYEHQNLRDERAEAFTSLLWEGVYTYSYVARATTPGTFVVPPTKAEEMYAPETFGRGAGDVVIVE
jgi:uncharacterized protein YfaS (alpha-2-macroglobulin family)